MNDKVDFRFEVTDEGTTWSMTIDWEILQQCIDECPRDERVVIAGTFDDDKLGKVLLELFRSVDELKRMGGRIKKQAKCKPRSPYMLWFRKKGSS